MTEILKPADLAETREKVHDLSLSEVIVYLKMKKNYYAGFLSHFTKISDPTEETMSVTIINARYVLRYHPEWYKYLTREEVETVLEHEMLHILLGHIPRFNRIYEATIDEDDRIKLSSVANAAGDLAVNSLLASSRYNKIPDSALLPKGYGLEDMRSMNYYLAELMDRVKIEKQEVVAVSVSLGGGEDNGQQGGEKNTKVVSDDQNLQDLMGNKHDWDMTKGDEDPAGQQPKTSKDIASSVEAQAQKAMTDAYKEIAGMSGGNGCGKIPGFVMEKISQSLIRGHGTSTWKRLLDRYVRDTKEKLREFRINTPKRSAWSLDQDLGAYGSDVENLKFSIEVGIDTSGSMSSKTIKEILEFTQGLMKIDEELQVRITEYDTQIQKQYLLHRCGQVDSRVLGRGGTDFNAFFRNVRDVLVNKKSGYKPDIVFNFTDGEASPPREEYRFKQVPMIWVLKQGGVNPCPEYGDSVSM